MFISGTRETHSLSPLGVLLRNRTCFRHEVGHQLLFRLLLSCLGREERLLQVLAFPAGFPAPSGISLLPGWVLAPISGFL